MTDCTAMEVDLEELWILRNDDLDIGESIAKVLVKDFFLDYFALSEASSFSSSFL